MLFSKSPAYLIDTENVGSTWTNLLKNDEKMDLFIFVTENAKNLNYSLLREVTENRKKNSFKIIDCEVGKNSLDFYLSSYLGYLIGKDKNSEYVIVSQDTGYDHIIEYWKKEGVNVSKINTKPVVENKPKTTRTKKAKPLEEKKTSEKRVIKKKEETPVQKKPKASKELPKKEDKPAEVKPVENKPVDLKPAVSSDLTGRKLLLRNTLKDYPDTDIDDIFKTLQNIKEDKREDKNFIYRTLVRRFKKEKGLAIYTLLKKDLKKYYSLSENEEGAVEKLRMIKNHSRS